MNKNFNQCSLYLYPKAFTLNNDSTQKILEQLKKIEFIADAIPHKQVDFFLGEKYLNHIAYMGCSPDIQFEPTENNEKFCFVKIHQHQEKKLMVSKVQVKPPQCPSCKKPMKSWQDLMTASTLTCESCQSTSDLTEINWRKMGGYSQIFIEITDIFPKEAIPQQALLNALNSVTDTEWLYFYSCQ